MTRDPADFASASAAPLMDDLHWALRSDGSEGDVAQVLVSCLSNIFENDSSRVVHRIRYNGANLDVLDLRGSGVRVDVDLNLLTHSLLMSDTKVMGQQGAAIANATDAASAIMQLNLLLAQLRVHGLIAS